MLLTREEVFSKVAEIILNADSISIMEFVLELEDEFGTEISDEDAEKIETVGAAVDYIMENNQA